MYAKSYKANFHHYDSWTIRKTHYLIETSSVLPIQLDYELKISIVRKVKEVPPDC